jgi:hypothetical protein
LSRGCGGSPGTRRSSPEAESCDGACPTVWCRGTRCGATALGRVLVAPPVLVVYTAAICCPDRAAEGRPGREGHTYGGRGTPREGRDRWWWTLEGRAGFALPNRSGVPPTLGSGIPSGTGGIPLNTAEIQKSKMRRLYNRFGAVHRSVRVVYRSVRAVYR